MDSDQNTARSQSSRTCYRRLVELILNAKPRPEQGFRACLGILRLVRGYGIERVEAACQRGIDIGARTYQGRPREPSFPGAVSISFCARSISSASTGGAQPPLA